MCARLQKVVIPYSRHAGLLRGFVSRWTGRTHDDEITMGGGLCADRGSVQCPCRGQCRHQPSVRRAGGNGGAIYQNDFVELFNRSASPVNLVGLDGSIRQFNGHRQFQHQRRRSPFREPYSRGSTTSVKLAGGATNRRRRCRFRPLMRTASSPNLSGTGRQSRARRTLAAGLACNGGFESRASAEQTRADRRPRRLRRRELSRKVARPAAGAKHHDGGSLASMRAARDTDNNGADFTATDAGAAQHGHAARPAVGSPGTRRLSRAARRTSRSSSARAALRDLSASDADGFVTSAAITSSPVSGITLGAVTSGSTLTTQLLVSRLRGGRQLPGGGDVHELGRDAADRDLHDRRQRRAAFGRRAHPRHPGPRAHSRR